MVMHMPKCTCGGDKTTQGIGSPQTEFLESTQVDKFGSKAPLPADESHIFQALGCIVKTLHMLYLQNWEEILPIPVLSILGAGIRGVTEVCSYKMYY